jgi:lactate 2-monooxygenase
LFGLLKRYPGNFFQNIKSRRALAAVRQFTSIYTNPALTWEKIGLLRKFTSLPILLKGILHPDDARKALEAGVDGIVVSNHGGRQVDGALAALDALPAIAGAVQGRIPVLMDSGIRSGADIFKALALGATAVCLGRPYVYGLALAGEEGVKEVISNILAEFELTMALSGCRNLKEITRECLVNNQ